LHQLLQELNFGVREGALQSLQIDLSLLSVPLDLGIQVAGLFFERKPLRGTDQGQIKDNRVCFPESLCGMEILS